MAVLLFGWVVCCCPMVAVFGYFRLRVLLFLNDASFYFITFLFLELCLDGFLGGDLGVFGVWGFGDFPASRLFRDG